jgi:hypothetical protein
MSLEPCPRVLLGGTLIDGTGRPPIKDAIIVIEGEWIRAVGDKEEIEVPEGSEVYNVQGMTILPGLIDSHVHFLRMGASMITTLNLSDTRSIAEVLERVRERAEECEDGEWIIGRGWDEAKWEERRYITKEDLDPLTPGNPVTLTRVCGHLITVNSKGMEIAGVKRDTPTPPGGRIDKDEMGEPTGILRDCRRLVQHAIPETTEETMVEGLLKASNHALSLGCTGVGDPGLGAKEIKAYQTALKKGNLKVKASLMLGPEIRNHSYAMGIKTGFGNQMVRIGPVKLFMDGSLGAHTAALFEPYNDDPANRGLLLTEPEDMDKLVKKAHSNDCQAAVHAIGDRAIEYAINSIQEALREEPMKGHRHRIEHCEVLTPQQIERIKQLEIIPAMQPNFIGEWSGPDSMYESRLGPRRDRMTNPYRDLLDEDIMVAFGSDGMPFTPIYGIWSAVNHPIRSSRISLVEAVKCYTYNSAYATFEEEYKGSLEVGKLADVTIFDRDLTEIPEEEIRKAEVYMTLVNGKILYHKEE